MRQPRARIPMEPETSLLGDSGASGGHTVAEWRQIAGRVTTTRLRNAIRAALVGRWDDEVVTCSAAFAEAVEREDRA